MNTIGQRLQSRRKTLGLSQEELAHRMGTNQKQISRYERGENLPTSEVIVKMARSLNTTTDWLLELTEYSERHIRGIGDLTYDERALVYGIRRKSPEDQERIKEALKLLVNS